ncbi:hypothetical protein DM860_012761 [Cuscuta australis]|uniref:Uncharacterized protein n=1 Tax=Cuscuta australis TaxID=267555 RepID=A0A328DXX1_9ASTE|nr:hypothetical protein DM860_012761 [Cuscuta australis]
MASTEKDNVPTIDMIELSSGHLLRAGLAHTPKVRARVCYYAESKFFLPQDLSLSSPTSDCSGISRSDRSTFEFATARVVQIEAQIILLLLLLLLCLPFNNGATAWTLLRNQHSGLGIVARVSAVTLGLAYGNLKMKYLRLSRGKRGQRICDGVGRRRFCREKGETEADENEEIRILVELFIGISALPVIFLQSPVLNFFRRPRSLIKRKSRHITEADLAGDFDFI